MTLADSARLAAAFFKRSGDASRLGETDAQGQYGHQDLQKGSQVDDHD